VSVDNQVGGAIVDNKVHGRASEVDVATAEEIILASEELDRLVSELHHRESFRAADVHKLV